MRPGLSITTIKHTRAREAAASLAELPFSPALIQVSKQVILVTMSENSSLCLQSSCSCTSDTWHDASTLISFRSGFDVYAETRRFQWKLPSLVTNNVRLVLHVILDILRISCYLILSSSSDHSVCCICDDDFQVTDRAHIRANSVQPSNTRSCTHFGNITTGRDDRATHVPVHNTKSTSGNVTILRMSSTSSFGLLRVRGFIEQNITATELGAAQKLVRNAKRIVHYSSDYLEVPQSIPLK